MKDETIQKAREEAFLAQFIAFVESEASRIDEERHGLRRRDGGRKLSCMIFMRQFLTAHDREKAGEVMRRLGALKKPSLTKPARAGIIGTMAINFEYNQALADALSILKDVYQIDTSNN